MVLSSRDRVRMDYTKEGRWRRKWAWAAELVDPSKTSLVHLDARSYYTNHKRAIASRRWLTGNDQNHFLPIITYLSLQVNGWWGALPRQERYWRSQDTYYTYNHFVISYAEQTKTLCVSISSLMPYVYHDGYSGDILHLLLGETKLSSDHNLWPQ